MILLRRPGFGGQAHLRAARFGGRACTLALALVGGTLVSFAAAPQFDRVQPELFAEGGAFANAWADADNDGDLDLFVGFGGTANRLYRNDKGVFTEAGGPAGLNEARATRAAAWGDFDRDGDPDLLVGYTPGTTSVLQLYRNQYGRFTNITATAGLSIDTGAVRQPVWIDVDHDGDLDLFVAFRDRPNALFRNDNGKFTDIAPEVGLDDARKTVGAVWFDYDNDGDLDVFAANMDGDANGLFRNNGGKFTDVAEAAGVAWGGRARSDAASGTVRACAGDFDNDGRLDLFMANYGPNGVFLARDGGVFEDVSEAWGTKNSGKHDTCALADIDNDGRLDVYVNGTVTGGVSYRDFLLRNTGRSFEDVTPQNIVDMQASHGAQWADFDSDGDMDLAIAGSRPDATHSLFRNLLQAADAARSLHVRVVDADGRATRAGTIVRVRSAKTKRLLGVRLVDAGSGYDSQNDMPVHFGLAAIEPVDVEVVWPGAGKTVTATLASVTPKVGEPLLVKVSAK